MDVLLASIALQVLGGLGALLCSRSPRWATALGAGGAVAGCLLGLVPTLPVLLGGTPLSLSVPWDASHGSFAVGLDPLSAFFLLPVLVLSPLAAVYGADYLLASRKEKSLGGPWFFFNAFVAGMVLVVIARAAVLFLVAWEAMSLAAFFLVTFEHEKAEVRKAGWIYLAATHLGVAFLFAAFVLLGRQAGSLDFDSFGAAAAPGPVAAGLVFVLALVGFGTKAGFVPLHVWLPEAHPAAPSHVSALMSGVMIKMGLYGLLRVLTFLGPPQPWWGPTLAAVGLITGLVGIALALSQCDLKRVLAYSSIENVGLIALALGVGLWGWAGGLPAVAALGFTAALLHVWNHALMKGLLFLAAGSVLHGTGTRDVEKLGGLMKRMPWTASLLLAGAVAIAGLPPSNGFVSEWLTYLGLMKGGLETGGAASLAALLAVGLLALVGGLAVIAFVRLTGIALLGTPRSEAAEHAHEASWWLVGPMVVLAALCLTVAVVPNLVVRLLSAPLDQLLRQEAGRTLLDLEQADAPLFTLGTANAWLLAAVGLASVALFALTRRRPQAQGPTWGCGYAKPTVRMQYTGRSFAEMMAEHLLPRLLRPRTHKQAPRGLFPTAGGFEADCPDPVREGVYEPFFRRWADRFTRLRVLQQGHVNVYVLYVLLTVMIALAWLSLRTWWGTS
jgi:formate hydrogenlyase subunit 3/multisubunit Na+/H+ antiporter MnhD subunit